MYTARPVATNTNKRNVLPLAGICCLGVLGFIIAGTIVLALIPVYLPDKDLTFKHHTNGSGSGSGGSSGGGTSGGGTSGGGTSGGGTSGGGTSGGGTSGGGTSGGGTSGGGTSGGGTSGGGTSGGGTSGGGTSGGGTSGGGGGSSQLQPFYVVYSVSGTTIDTGTLINLLEIQQLLNQLFGLNSVLIVQAGQTQTRFARRRRRHDSDLHRRKRTLVSNVLLQCIPQLSSTCSNSTCIDDLNTLTQNAVQSVQTLSSVPFNISSKQFGLTQVAVTLSFVELTLTRPAGFDGEPYPFDKFVASQSGLFTDPSTWLQHIVPYGDSEITIEADVVVTLETNLLDLNASSFFIYGTLILGSSANATLTFQYSTNIEVYPGGTLEDQTSDHQIYLSSSTLLIIYSGGSFIGDDTVLSSYTSLPAANSVVQSLPLGSAISGPRTVGVLRDGSILTFRKVTFFAVNSGDFTDNNTWLGDVSPSFNSVCKEGDGCGAYITGETILSTNDTDNELNTVIDFIIVSDGGVLLLQTSDPTQGFVFHYPVNLRVLPGGRIEDATTTKKIYLPAGSLLMLLPDGSFIGNDTVIFDYAGAPTTVDVTGNYSISSNISGPLTVYFYFDGYVPYYFDVEFLVTQSGDIGTDDIWYGGLAPDALVCLLAKGCYIYFNDSWVLSIESLNNELDINIRFFELVNGSVLHLGTTGLLAGFTFEYPVTIRALPGGQVVDGTALNQVYFPTGSLIMLLPNSSFIGNDTVIFAYFEQSGAVNITDNTTIASELSGPVSVYFYYDGHIYNLDYVEFLVVQSGDIKADATWYGDADPEAYVCRLAGGCVISFNDSWTLSTESLDNQCDIDIRYIQIDDGCVLELGTPGVTDGFTFLYPVSILASPGGKVIDVTESNEFYFQPDSFLQLYPNASFIGQDIFISSYEQFPASENVIQNITIGSDVHGPFSVVIDDDGLILYGPYVIFVVAESGDAKSVDTWVGDIIPSPLACRLAEGCFIYVTSRYNLSTQSLNNDLDSYWKYIFIDNDAALELGTSGVNDGFTFSYPTAIFALPGGKIVDEIESNKLYLTPDSTIIVFPDASFIGDDIVISSYTAQPANENVVENVTIGSNIRGPFSVVIDDDGSIFDGPYVIFVVAESGEATSADTWVGDVTPSPPVCKLAKGCVVYVSSKYTLSTQSLDNDLDSYWRYIFIDNDAALELGTLGVSDGFTFFYPVTILAFPGGKIVDQTESNDFYLKPDSTVIILPNASFIGDDIVISSYTARPASDNVVENVTIGSNIRGPFSLAITDEAYIHYGFVVAFVVRKSGEATSTDTWVGDITPSPPVCELAEGCLVYISSEYTLSTKSLDNDLDSYWRYILIEDGSVLQLGTPGVSDGFTFFYPVTILAFPGSKIVDETESNDFYLKPDSTIVLTPNASFIGDDIVISSYTTQPASENVIDNITIGSDVHGSFTVLVDVEASIHDGPFVAFVVKNSGELTSDDIWVGDIAPYSYICKLADGCLTQLYQDFTVTTETLENKLDIYLRYIIVVGSSAFELGTPGLGEKFTFTHPVSIQVYGNGKLVDKTELHEFDVRADSIIQLFPNATFVNDGVNVSSFIHENGKAIDEVEIPANVVGPYTLTVDRKGMIIEIPLVFFEVEKSGDFLSADIWAGKLPPDHRNCHIADGCLVYIKSHCTLSTESLDGILDIYIDIFVIEKDAVLQLGSEDDTKNFEFQYPLSIHSLGRLEDVNGPGTDILIPGNSLIFIQEGSFVTSEDTTLQPYHSSTNQKFGTPLALPEKTSAPYIIFVYKNGTISVEK